MVVFDESQTCESGGEDGTIYNVPFQTVVAMEVRSLVFEKVDWENEDRRRRLIYCIPSNHGIILTNQNTTWCCRASQTWCGEKKQKNVEKIRGALGPGR